MYITVTRTHWDRAMAQAPQTLRYAYTKPQYLRKCVVAQALEEAGFRVERVDYESFETTDGKVYALPKSVALLIAQFNQAVDAVAAGKTPVVPGLPHLFVIKA